MGSGSHKCHYYYQYYYYDYEILLRRFFFFSPKSLISCLKGQTIGSFHRFFPSLRKSRAGPPRKKLTYDKPGLTEDKLKVFPDFFSNNFEELCLFGDTTGVTFKRMRSMKSEKLSISSTPMVLAPLTRPAFSDFFFFALQKNNSGALVVSGAS